jgi:hypothetical protein
MRCCDVSRRWRLASWSSELQHWAVKWQDTRVSDDFATSIYKTKLSGSWKWAYI